MKRPIQGCLFESDRPRWDELLTTTRESLRQLMQQLLLDAATRRRDVLLLHLAGGDTRFGAGVDDGRRALRWSVVGQLASGVDGGSGRAGETSAGRVIQVAPRGGAF